MMKVDSQTLVATVSHWNGQCLAGKDDDFHRPPGTMMPLTHPPFYAMEAWPIVSNTQGGPVHDPQQRVVDSMGKPIPRLYAAGDISSIFGHLYLEAGNITECFVGGRIAGRNAALEEAWS